MKRWNLRKMGEIVNQLAKVLPSMVSIRRNLGHDKIALAQCRPLRVNTYENIGYNINVKILSKLNYTNSTISNFLKRSDC